MIRGGYILQPRIIDDSEIMDMPPLTRELWFYLLRNVNHKDYKKIRRGQGLFTFKEIIDDLNWHIGYRKMGYSKPQLTKSLRRLREGNMITTTKATRGIIITICKYDYYQDPKNYEGNEEKDTKDQRRKEEGNTKYKNDKNDKNVSNKLMSKIKISDVDVSFQSYFKIALSFQVLFIKNLKEKGAPTIHQKNATFKNYVTPIRLMFEKDEVTLTQIRQVYDYLNSVRGDFWKQNILSTNTLRKKFSELVIKANTTDEKKSTPTSKAATYYRGKTVSSVEKPFDFSSGE